MRNDVDRPKPDATNPDGDARPETKAERTYWLDDPRNVRKLLRVFFVLCAGLFLVDFLEYVGLFHKEIHFGIQKVPGFFGIYGFVGCVLLVIIAKAMRVFLMRPEDYYDR